MIQYPQISPKDIYVQGKVRTYYHEQFSLVAQNQGELENRKSQLFICPQHTLEMTDNLNEFWREVSIELSVEVCFNFLVIETYSYMWLSFCKVRTKVDLSQE